jgi:hypothetical protein
LLDGLTRVLLRRAQLGTQIVVGRLRGRDHVAAGVLRLIDLFLLGGDLGVGVVEVRVEAERVDPDPDHAGGEKTGDGDPAPWPLARRVVAGAGLSVRASPLDQARLGRASLRVEGSRARTSPSS